MIDYDKISGILNDKGVCYTKTKGTSMRPFIKEGRDTIEFVKPKGELKKYDMALYLRGDGKYCMHRVLKVRQDDYFIMGDNTTQKEYIKKSEVIAVALGYYKKEKYIDCNSNKFYRFKVKTWCFCIPLRNLYVRGRNFCVKVLNNIFKRGK